MEKLRPTKSDERNPTPKQLIKVTNRAVEKLPRLNAATSSAGTRR